MPEHVNRRISCLYRYNQRYLAWRLRPAGLEVGQMPALMQAWRSPGVTQEEISVNIGMDKGTTARSLQQLERGGLVLRAADPEDRRVNHIYLTARGEEMIPAVRAAVEGLHEVLYRGFSEEEVALAGSLLGRMQENMRTYVREAQEGKDAKGTGGRA